MTIRYTNEFLDLLKKQNVKVKKSFKEAIREFSKNPNSPVLQNHNLKREWVGYRSIDITSDYRAIYKEVKLLNDVVIYFTTIGTHKELYKS